MVSVKDFNFPRGTSLGVEPARNTGDMKQSYFIRGPIPLTWITQAGALPGKSLHVGVALWFLRGVNKSSTVRLSSGLIRRFAFDRSTAYRALLALEKAGLVAVVRHRGKNPMVTILDALPPNPEPSSADDLTGRCL